MSEQNKQWYKKPLLVGDWRSFHGERHVEILIHDVADIPIALAEDERRATQIVTAVNAHDALVAIAQYADEQIDLDSPRFADAGDSERVQIEVSLRWFRMVRAALKLAEGEPSNTEENL